MIEVTVRITTPLSQEDNLLLNGLTMMMIHVAGERGALQQPPTEATTPSVVQTVTDQLMPCGELEYVDEPDGPHATGRSCVGSVGHRGRHKFREIAPGLSLVN